MPTSTPSLRPGKSRAVLALVFTLPSLVTAVARAAEIQPANILGELARLQAAPPNATRGAERARLLWFLGADAASPSDRRAYFEKGRDAAAAALAADANHPGAILWWSANIGSIAALDRNLSSLRTIGKVQSALKRLKEIAPGYAYAGADRALGMLYLEAPSFISVGSNAMARLHLESALRAFPDYPGNCITYARCLLESGRAPEARGLAAEVLHAPNLAQFPLEAPGWIRAAQEITQNTANGQTGGAAH